METRYAPVLFLFASLLTTFPGSSQIFYAARSPEISPGQVNVLDLSTGLSSATIIVTDNGQNVDGLTGMAHDYTTGQTYVVVKDGPNFSLATIDLLSGVLSNSVSLPDKFAGITFDASGTLYGITGDGAAQPETLYEIDPSTGNATLVLALPAGGDGEAIAFNTSQGLIYRYGGTDVFQRIDPTLPAVTDIGLEYEVDNFAHALTLDFSTIGQFYFTAGDTIYSLTTDGDLSVLSVDQPVSGNGWKGLVPESVAAIGEMNAELVLEAYPNPAADELFLRGLSPGTWLHEVVDAAGRTVLQVRSATDPVRIGLIGLPSGRYTVRSSSGGRKAVTPFVVR